MVARMRKQNITATLHSTMETEKVFIVSGVSLTGHTVELVLTPDQCVSMIAKMNGFVGRVDSLSVHV
jgi:hypothetical protein